MGAPFVTFTVGEFFTPHKRREGLEYWPRHKFGTCIAVLRVLLNIKGRKRRKLSVNCLQYDGGLPLHQQSILDTKTVRPGQGLGVVRVKP